ncbi:hypothetical protein LSAT2_000931, partial [Lamellibrachia satsuma]
MRRQSETADQFAGSSTSQRRCYTAGLDGFLEATHDTWEQREELVKGNLKKKAIPAEEVEQMKMKPRTNVVKFTFFEDSEMLLQKPKVLFVSEDYSLKTVQRRKYLLSKMMFLRVEGKYVYVS